MSFGEGSALDLSFPDNQFDITASLTVLEEVNAEQAMAELTRVTKPGGRVAVLVRSLDMPPLTNVDLPEDVLNKVRQGLNFAGVSPGGCADGSLYRLFAEAGLKDIHVIPQYNTTAHQLPFTIGRMADHLTPVEKQLVDEKRAALGDTFFVAMPFHSAVGTKPS